ncbi:MAG: transketolase, partial [Mogibacterium sp.]|nr:transketolase [Mogibacterium sp.]
EGPTWEAATSACHYGLDNIIGIVDMNGIQADGLTSSVVSTEPLDEKFRAFGFDVQRINGNNMGEVVKALDHARNTTENKPHMIVCDTTPGFGLDFLIGNPKAHFISLDDEGWERAFKELERGRE